MFRTRGRRDGKRRGPPRPRRAAIREDEAEALALEWCVFQCAVVGGEGIRLAEEALLRFAQTNHARLLLLIGRTPDAGVFLDDVTVSRNHALFVRRKEGLYIDDLGSLNGTYVNRRRIESHKLDDGDEIQIGKYKLSYLEK